jgi:Coenzyme PQQ synthesis protein D (PqqD)
MLPSTMPDRTPSETMRSVCALPTSRITVPDHVAHRSLPSETVVLNLQTGRYHGLNPTAGSMLEALERATCVRDAAAAVAEEYAQPPAIVERDMCDLCEALLARGLIELDGEPSH